MTSGFAFAGSRRRSNGAPPGGAAPPPPPEAFERCLVAVARTGDRAAFAALFAHFAPRLKTYFRRLGATGPAAEDLAQETLLRVWVRAGGFDPARGTAAAWVFAIARNLRLNALRGERPTLALEGEDEAAEAWDTAPGPEGAFALAEGEARLRRVLRDLPGPEAWLLDQAFFADKSHRQIGREHGVPLGTVKSRLRRSLLRLRAALADLP